MVDPASEDLRPVEVERVHPSSSSDKKGDPPKATPQAETKKEKEEIEEEEKDADERDIEIPPPHTKPPDGWWGCCSQVAKREQLSVALVTRVS